MNGGSSGVQHATVARKVKEPLGLADDVLTLHERDGVLSSVLKDGEERGHKARHGRPRLKLGKAGAQEIYRAINRAQGCPCCCVQVIARARVVGLEDPSKLSPQKMRMSDACLDRRIQSDGSLMRGNGILKQA